MSTNKERLDANNQRIDDLTKLLNNKMLSIKGNGEYLIRVIDYDGTILDEQYLNTGDVYTLPEPPTHDGLTFQEWSSTMPIEVNTFTVRRDCIIGAVYTTTSGKHEFDIVLTEATGLTVTGNFSSNDGQVDWGDGTYENANIHTYSDYGKYTIKTRVVLSGFLDKGFFNQDSSNRNHYCTAIRLTNYGGNKIYPDTFTYCESLESISIPNGITDIDERAFQYCRDLNAIVLPTSLTVINASCFHTCSSSKNAVIPYSVSKFYKEAFRSNYFLEEVFIPDDVSVIVTGSFYYGYGLKRFLTSEKSALREFSQTMFGYSVRMESVKVPPKVTTIETQAFYYIYNLREIDFSKHTSVPALINTNAFTGINALCKIIVPDNLYNEWIVATNWSDMADYIYKASEV